MARKIPKPRQFGEMPGVPVGSTYEDRTALAVAGVHRPRMAGISGSVLEGCDSIVLNGGYEDDEDQGDAIVYTGHGGNDPDTGKQIAGQELRGGNLALARSCVDGLPVRVIRGWREPSGLGPPSGFRYDGLYYVERFWSEVGRSGHRIWRFRLMRDDPAPPPWRTLRRVAEERPRRHETIQRIVRNTFVTQQAKELYGYRCQMCEITLDTPGGPYAEGAHIRPLGRPHDGHDVPDNVLCLCPNHHVLLDTGAIIIMDDLVIIDRLRGVPIGSLTRKPEHHISTANLQYHRGIWLGSYRPDERG